MLKKIRSLTYQHALLAAFIIFGLYELLLSGLGKLLSLLPNTLPFLYLIEIILILVPIGIVCFFGFSNCFKKGGFLRGLLYASPLFVFQAISLIIFFSQNVGNPDVTWRPWYVILYFLITNICVGIREECIYRATLQNIIAKKYTNSVKGIWITVIFSSLFFGLCHISNVFFGMEPLSVLTQVISAAFLGLLYGAIYLRSGNIWVLIVLHSVTDIVGLAGSNFLVGSNDIEQMSETMAFSIGKAIMWLIYIGFAIFLLRPSKCKEICERFRRENEEL